MDVATAIETRRSFRHFDPSHEISEAEIDRLVSPAMQSPTPGNTQPWRLVVVRDPALQLRAAAFDQVQARMLPSSSS